jgi:flagellin-like protein
MKLKNLFTDDEAVSPVIGVILMVAITVILAAVIGAFVLGIGSNQEAAPQASIAFAYDQPVADNFTVTHDGGESVELDKLSISGAVNTTNCGMGSDTASAGDNMLKFPSCKYTGSGQTITITWTASSGDSSQILKESTTP